MDFNGQLKTNEIFSALYNMIISQEVFADNIQGDDLVDRARNEGTLYGDTKLFYATDALKSVDWDASDNNVLATHRPPAPKCQAITLDKFRQIALTVDNYLSKRAWSDEYAFGSFNSVMLGWMSDTKKIYDGSTYDAFIGTHTTKTGKQYQTITATDAADGKKIAEKLANIVTDMTKRFTRDYNEYSQIRRYSNSQLIFIFNSSYINRITNVDLPVIFDNAGLKSTFSKTVLAPEYFGDINTSAKVADGKLTRSLIEQEINDVHYFAGDLIASGATAPAGTSYQVNDSYICKIYVKLPPYMSAFEVGTSFFNAKSLTENHYLTFGHNTLEALKAYPCVTLAKA